MEPIDPMAQEMSEMLARLTETRRAADEATRLVGTISHTQMSKRRLFSVTVGGSGDLQELTFNGESYRSLAPAELATMIVETIKEARNAYLDKASAEFSRVFPEGGEQFELLSGSASLDELMTNMLRGAGAELTEEEIAEFEQSWRGDR